MRFRSVLFLITLLSSGPKPVAAQNVTLPPLLQVEMRRHPERFAAGAIPGKDLRSPDHLLLGVEVDRPGAWKEIAALGGRINTRLGDWGTVRLPKTAVNALTAIPGLRALHYNPLFFPHNEQALRHVQADKVHAGLAPLPRGYSGKDVVVGIIDTGVDYLHEDFRDPADPTRSRIAYIWDQWTDNGTNPDGFSYGAEWTRADIEAALTAAPASGEYFHRDTFPQGAGHGTHVGGTAAGLRGVAFEADLIVVATTFFEASILDAANYILQKATEMGKPCVINLSLGSNVHAHDGTDFLSEGLSRLLDGTEGKAIVASAGNDGHRLMHWGGFPLSDQPASVFYAGGTGVSAYLRLPKTEAADFEISIAADTARYENGSPRSIAEIGATPWLKPAEIGDQPYDQAFYYDNDSLAAELLLFNLTKAEKDYAEFYILLDEGWDQYNWTRHRDELELFRFYVRGTGNFHAWFSSYKLFTYPTPETAGRTDPNYRPANTELNLGSPCDGRNVLCVGAYVNRAKWTDLDGKEWDWPPLQEAGELANFSSTGPTIDGRVKPEIVAPGKVVASAVPAYNDYGIFLTQDAPREAVFSGTSMSAPMASGVLALLLEENPALTYEDLYRVVVTSARRDAQTQSDGPLPNGHWGYGKLDAYRAMSALLGVTNTQNLQDATGLFSVFPNPARGHIDLLFDHPEQQRGELRLRDLHGRIWLYFRNLPPGPVDVSALPRGMYLLEWTDGGRRTVEKLVLN